MSKATDILEAYIEWLQKDRNNLRRALQVLYDRVRKQEGITAGELEVARLALEGER